MEFDRALLILGALMLVLGLLSGWIRSSILSEPLIALLIGVGVGPEVTGILDLNRWGAQDQILEQATRLTLAISLMAVALRLPRGHVRRRWRALLSFIGLGMPAMWLMSSLLLVVILGLPLPMALLVGAAITPTDPVVAASIVTGKVAESNLPARMRDVISAESGANDGLALPFVAAALVLVQVGPGGDWGHWFVKSVLLEVGGAIVFGWVLGYLAGRLLEWALGKKEIETTSRLGYTIALSLTALGSATLLHVNEVLAVFVTGLSFDNAVRERDRAEEQTVQEAINRFFMLPIFLLLGLALPYAEWRELGVKGLLLALAVLALRRLPAFLLMGRFLKVMHGGADALYIGWFGPIGVAALYYALYAKEHTGSHLPWTIATLVVVASLFAHGLSATPFTRMYGRNGGRAEAATDDSSESG